MLKGLSMSTFFYGILMLPLFFACFPLTYMLFSLIHNGISFKDWQQWRFSLSFVRKTRIFFFCVFIPLWIFSLIKQCSFNQQIGSFFEATTYTAEYEVFLSLDGEKYIKENAVIEKISLKDFKENYDFTPVSPYFIKKIDFGEGNIVDIEDYISPEYNLILDNDVDIGIDDTLWCRLSDQKIRNISTPDYSDVRFYSIALLLFAFLYGYIPIPQFRKSKKNFIIKHIHQIVNNINEQNSSFNINCLNDILPIVNQILNNSDDNLAELKDTSDYENAAHRLLFNIAFDLLASGKYHIYRGQLNPMGYGHSLYILVDNSLSYFVKNGSLSEQEKSEQIDILREHIATVG